MWPSSVRVSTSSRSKSAPPWKIGSSPVRPVITGKSVTWTMSTRPAAISARFIDRAGDPWVTHVGLLGARCHHLHEGPVRVGPEDHPLFFVVQGEAVVEEFGALLAPVAGPVAAGRAVTVEAGEDVEGVGSGHASCLLQTPQDGYR